LTPFLRNREANKSTLKKATKNITGKGTTNIHTGIENALWMLANRKYKNPISCIFLLTDG